MLRSIFYLGTEQVRFSVFFSVSRFKYCLLCQRLGVGRQRWRHTRGKGIRWERGNWGNIWWWKGSWWGVKCACRWSREKKARDCVCSRSRRIVGLRKKILLRWCWRINHWLRLQIWWRGCHRSHTIKNRAGRRRREAISCLPLVQGFYLWGTWLRRCRPKPTNELTSFGKQRLLISRRHWLGFVNFFPLFLLFPLLL
jgi:hypothetical protein